VTTSAPPSPAAEILAEISGNYTTSKDATERCTSRALAGGARSAIVPAATSEVSDTRVVHPNQIQIDAGTQMPVVTAVTSRKRTKRVKFGHRNRLISKARWEINSYT